MTAELMLRDFGNLKAGNWVIQNAANSAVGQYVMQLAHIYGYHTVNVVRREGLDDFIKKIEGDVCITDGPDLGERVKAVTDNVEIGLAIDAVAGEHTQHLSDCLTENGIIANYGLLSGCHCQLSPEDIIFRNISLRGIWLTQWLRGRGSTQEMRDAVYEELKGYIIGGRIHAEVEATYPLAQIKDALVHAMLGNRSGKIVILPNS